MTQPHDVEKLPSPSAALLQLARLKADMSQRELAERAGVPVALAQATNLVGWAGRIISARQLADAYGITDTDGSRPDCWGYLVRNRVRN